MYITRGMEVSMIYGILSAEELAIKYGRVGRQNQITGRLFLCDPPPYGSRKNFSVFSFK